MKDIQAYIRRGKDLLNIEEAVEAHSQFGNWVGEISNWLNLRMPEEDLAKEWSDIGTSMLLVGSRYYNDVASWQIFHNVVKSRLKWLEELSVRLPSKEVVKPVKVRPKRGDTAVFLFCSSKEMHSHVVQFINKMKLKHVVSNGYMTKDQTLIIDHAPNLSKVSFAMVILTRDMSDHAAAQGPGPHGATFWEKTLIDLGYLIGKLGKKKVSILYEKGLAIPFHFEGIEMIQMDREGTWKMLMARAMKMAGIPIDMNLVL
jgi:predicted nucleotide-binding protein